MLLSEYIYEVDDHCEDYNLMKCVHILFTTNVGHDLC